MIERSEAPASGAAVRAMLAPTGVELVEADSGRQALRAVMERDFAVILMDVRMPTMDGYETARLIRERSQSAHSCIERTLQKRDTIVTANVELEAFHRQRAAMLG